MKLHFATIIKPLLLKESAIYYLNYIKTSYFLRQGCFQNEICRAVHISEGFMRRVRGSLLILQKLGPKPLKSNRSARLYMSLKLSLRPFNEMSEPKKANWS